MNRQLTAAGVRNPTAVLATNKVIRNTYMLLSMTLLFSALTAGVSMALNLPHPGLVLTLLVVAFFFLRPQQKPPQVVDSSQWSSHTICHALEMWLKM